MERGIRMSELQVETEREVEKMKVEFESRSCNESFARVVVAAFMSRMDPTVEEVDDVKTAVSEAVTNAIIHGYDGQVGSIEIRGEITDNTLRISIHDDGTGIEDIKQAMEPLYTGKSASERSGMGFSFMEAFMDEVEVLSKVGEGTTVVMKKTLGRRPYE